MSYDEPKTPHRSTSQTVDLNTHHHCSLTGPARNTPTAHVKPCRAVVLAICPISPALHPPHELHASLEV